MTGSVCVIDIDNDATSYVVNNVFYSIYTSTTCVSPPDPFIFKKGRLRQTRPNYRVMIIKLTLALTTTKQHTVSHTTEQLHS